MKITTILAFLGTAISFGILFYNVYIVQNTNFPIFGSVIYSVVLLGLATATFNLNKKEDIQFNDVSNGVVEMIMFGLISIIFQPYNYLNLYILFCGFFGIVEIYLSKRVK
jgi:ABC-type transporter Mla maintaining outer membrane lipid asymmetry permease subunit MlaE